MPQLRMPLGVVDSKRDSNIGCEGIWKKSQSNKNVLYKRNISEAIRRNEEFFSREMREGILLYANVSLQGIEGGKGAESSEWRERECRCLTDMNGIINECHERFKIQAQIQDDSLPVACPTVHFGESIYSGLLGGKIRFIGNEIHTCSGAEPLVRDWEKLKELQLDPDNYWFKTYLSCLQRAVEGAKGAYLIHSFITIDALNLAVELRGTTRAYLDVYENPEKLRELMSFGVEFNLWFYEQQQSILHEYNLRALGHSLALTLDLPTLSVDAYNICHERVYREMGFEYQQQLIEGAGGGHMHTHGTGIFRLLPEIVKLQGLTSLQVGRDLHRGESINMFEHLGWFRQAAGDIPLRTSLCQEEFEKGLEAGLLVGGVAYSVSCESVEKANELAEKAREYKAHGAKVSG